MKHGRLWGAVAAQVSAQALTGWTLLLQFTSGPEVSIWAVAFLVAGALAPFRHDGSFRDRALGNFAAGTALAGFLWWEVVLGKLDSIVGGGGFELGVDGMMMLAGTVLFAIAGATFWILRDKEA